jgi:hypothetical protein
METLEALKWIPWLPVTLKDGTRSTQSSKDVFRPEHGAILKSVASVIYVGAVDQKKKNLSEFLNCLDIAKVPPIELVLQHLHSLRDCIDLQKRQGKVPQ